jgi:hypothetical protein
MQPGDVYIGRGGRGYPSSPWGNPFTLRQHSRDEAIAKFTDYLRDNPALQGLLPSLDGARLRCHCSAHEGCHGDSIIDSWKKAQLTSPAFPPQPPQTWTTV